MSHYTLYAYADGPDLENIAGAVEARFRQFVAGRPWIAGRPIVVNENHGPVVITEKGTEDLWHLGLRLKLPETGPEFPKWFADVEAIARFLGVLHHEFDRTFSLGFIDSETERNEELFAVSTTAGEAGKLPVIAGVRYIA